MAVFNRTIVLVGGGFSDHQYLDLDQFVISSSSQLSPKICFIPTASGDSKDYIQRFYDGFSSLNCEATHLELFRRSIDDIERFLMSADIIYVGGGNTANMLAIWRLHGVHRVIRRAYENGTVLAGISAGAACWFEECLTDSFGSLAPLHDGLGLLSGSFCPHFRTEPGRAELFTSLIHRGEISAGVALDDGVAVRYRNEQIERICKANREANYYMIRS